MLKYVRHLQTKSNKRGKAAGRYKHKIKFLLKTISTSIEKIKRWQLANSKSNVRTSKAECIASFCFKIVSWNLIWFKFTCNFRFFSYHWFKSWIHVILFEIYSIPQLFMSQKWIFNFQINTFTNVLFQPKIFKEMRTNIYVLFQLKLTTVTPLF